MALTREDNKEITCKVLYLGPKGSGKTSNLQALYSANSAEVQQGLFELEPAKKPTPFFDFLPLGLGKQGGYDVRLHLFAFPLESPFSALRKILLTAVDGFVFVADSRMIRMGENIESLKLAHLFLREEGYLVSDIPHVVQFNRRDELKPMPLSIMSRELNPFHAPESEAIATQARGTQETLSLLTRHILNRWVAN